MAVTDVPLWVVYQLLGEHQILAEALGVPEVARLGPSRDRLNGPLTLHLARFLESAPPAHHWRRPVTPAAPVLATARVAIDPGPGNHAWRAPLPLRFPIVLWAHGTSLHVAFVPALGIEVAAETPELLDQLLPREIRAALARARALHLNPLTACQRVGRLHLTRLTVQPDLKTPKQKLLSARALREQEPTVLRQVAVNLTRQLAEPAFGFDQLTEHLAEFLTARRPRSVLLVGPSGVGKTALVRELVRRRKVLHLGQTPFWSTSGARLVAGMCGYGAWQDRCVQMIKEAHRTRAVLHLGHLVELVQVGRSVANVTGVADFLRPYLARGELLAVAECTPEQIPALEREAPQVLDAFHRLTVPEPDEPTGRAILRHYAAHAPLGLRRDLPEDVLDVLDRLHRRFATYSAFPGRPIRFLHNLLRDHAGQALTAGDVRTAFARETGLPRVLLDPAVPLDLSATRDWFTRRVVGQEEAVDLVVDLLATTKAGLARPGKPIASLLFIGPTGVGKTELAKALAEFLFGAKDRLTRFDMSEYADPAAVPRLVGGVFGSEGHLTAKVREQPFSVVLLDEFEKAHPQVGDLLLQVLGEGRLTDAAGRLADFRNTVVILTSNLGAAAYQAGSLGFAGQGGATQRRASARDHFTRAVEAAMRPELVNRIDRLVPFAPLEADVIRRIAAGHLDRLTARDGLRYRGVALTVGDGVTEHLARVGFDARYGARPLLRATERELLAPLAAQLNRYPADQALTAEVRAEPAGLALRVRPRLDAQGRPVAAHAAGAPLVEAARAAVDLRRDAQALAACTAVRELANELFQDEQAQRHFERRQLRAAALRNRFPNRNLPLHPVTAADQERMSRLAKLRQLAERWRTAGEQAAALEDEVRIALYDGTPAEPAGFEGRAAQLRRAWEEVLLALYCRRFDHPDRVTLALFGEEPRWLAELASGYQAVAERRGAKGTLLAYRLPRGGKPTKEDKAAREEKAEAEPPAQFWREDRLIAAATARQPEKEVMRREQVEEPKAFLGRALTDVIGMAWEWQGPAVGPLLEAEGGQHAYKPIGQGQPERVLVEVSAARPAEYLPPAGITRKGAVARGDLRRTWDAVRAMVEEVGSPPARWDGGPVAARLAEWLPARLLARAVALVDEPVPRRAESVGRG